MVQRVHKPINEKDVKNEVKKEETQVDKDGYIRGIQKIASYSGVARIMKCDHKCGGFDDIINIYVYPNGAVVSEYNNPDNKVIGQYHGDNSISKDAVRKHGFKNLAMWGKNDTKIASRHKIGTNPIKRISAHKKGYKK